MSSKTWEGSASEERLKQIFDETNGNPRSRFKTIEEVYNSDGIFTKEFKLPTFKTHYSGIKKEWDRKALGSSSESFYLQISLYDVINLDLNMD